MGDMTINIVINIYLYTGVFIYIYTLCVRVGAYCLLSIAYGFFDETVPERSSWTVEFRRAQGSMQMSSGASIPELHILLRKRWPIRKGTRGSRGNHWLLEMTPRG